MDIEQIRKKAHSENTSPEILAELAKSKDTLTRKYVASNPNATAEILDKLAQEFPQEIIDNPILELLIFSNPEKLVEIKRSIALSTNTSESILDRLSNDSNRDVRYAVAKNYNASEKILDYLKEDEDKDIRLAVANNSNASEKTLDYLKEDEHGNVCLAVARNPNASEKTLDYLKGDEDECELYYADASIYGPHELNPDSQIPAPQGGGGTSFIPFFDQVAENWDGMTTGVCVYLTDGYGSFPKNPPQLPVLWVVTPNGLDLSRFPFGEAVRLLSV